MKVSVIKDLKNEFTLSENLPSSLFAKEGYYSRSGSSRRVASTSLWQREVRRDFINQCSHYYETVYSSISAVPEL
jgi:hypothetical protein